MLAGRVEVMLVPTYERAPNGTAGEDHFHPKDRSCTIPERLGGRPVACPMEAAMVAIARSSCVAFLAMLTLTSCGVELSERGQCLARYSTYIHFQFDEDVGLPYTVDVETREGSVSVLCPEYPVEDPYVGAVVTESNVERLEVGSIGGTCMPDRFSLIRSDEIEDVAFEVNGSFRNGAGSGTPVYHLRQESCRKDLLDGEILVNTQPVEDI